MKAKSKEDMQTCICCHLRMYLLTCRQLRGPDRRRIKVLSRQLSMLNALSLSIFLATSGASTWLWCTEGRGDPRGYGFMDGTAARTSSWNLVFHQQPAPRPPSWKRNSSLGVPHARGKGGWRAFASIWAVGPTCRCNPQVGSSTRSK